MPRAKNRQFACKKGHPRTEDNVMIVECCRACRNANTQACRERQSQRSK